MHITCTNERMNKAGSGAHLTRERLQVERLKRIAHLFHLSQALFHFLLTFRTLIFVSSFATLPHS